MPDQSKRGVMRYNCSYLWRNRAAMTPPSLPPSLPHLHRLRMAPRRPMRRLLCRHRRRLSRRLQLTGRGTGSCRPAPHSTGSSVAAELVEEVAGGGGEGGPYRLHLGVKGLDGLVVRVQRCREKPRGRKQGVLCQAEQMRV
jgi:hypothetical protein